MKNHFHAPFRRTWLVAFLALIPSCLATMAFWGGSEPSSSEEMIPRIIAGHLDLFTHWQFYVAAIVAALAYSRPAIKWSALMVERGSALMPWALSAPVWNALWVVWSNYENPELAPLSSWIMGAVVGAWLGLVLARNFVVRPARLLGFYGFNSPYLKFKASKNDDKIVFRLPKMKGKVKVVEVDMAALEMNFDDEWKMEDVSWRESSTGTAYGPNGMTTIVVPGAYKSARVRKYSGLMTVKIPGVPYDTRVALTSREANELLEIYTVFHRESVPREKTAKADAAREAHDARYAREKINIMAKAGLPAVAEPLLHEAVHQDTGEILFMIFTQTGGRGGLASYWNNTWDEWYGNWSTARVIECTDKVFLVEVSDPAYEKANMAKRVLNIPRLNLEQRHLWRTRIEMIAKQASADE